MWYRNWATRLIFLHSAVFMPHRFLVPGRQTNVGGRQTRPTVINFPRVNVSTRPHGQRLLFVHQFSIHFRSRRAVHLAIASAGTRAEKANRRLLLLLLREIEREYPQSPGCPLSICGGRVRSYVADPRQTRLPRGSLPSGETLLFRNCSGRILPWISRVKHADEKRSWETCFYYSNEFEQRLSKFTSFGKFCRARMIEGYFWDPEWSFLSHFHPFHSISSNDAT